MSYNSINFSNIYSEHVVIHTLILLCTLNQVIGEGKGAGSQKHLLTCFTLLRLPLKGWICGTSAGGPLQEYGPLLIAAGKNATRVWICGRYVIGRRHIFLE